MPQALRRSGSGSDAGAPLCRALQTEEHGGRHRHAPESGFRRRQGVTGIRFTGCTARITLRVTSMPVRAVPIVSPSWNTSCVSGFSRVCRKSFLQALPAGSVSPLPLHGRDGIFSPFRDLRGGSVLKERTTSWRFSCTAQRGSAGPRSMPS